MFLTKHVACHEGLAQIGKADTLRLFGFVTKSNTHQPGYRAPAGSAILLEPGAQTKPPERII
jgi:hypothetical protein